MREGLPDEATVRSAVELAIRAPSIHNSQPWTWSLGDSSLHLFADLSRQLPATDSGGRDLLLSCGAALHHLRVACAALGWATIIHRMPNPAQPEHLAAVEFTRQRPRAADIAMSTAIMRRQTDRRRFSSWPVPPILLAQLAERAAEQGVLLVTVTHPAERLRLTAAIDEAAARQNADPAYSQELAQWTGRGTGAHEGVTAANIPAAHSRNQGAGASRDPRHGDTTMRTFDQGYLAPLPADDDEDAAELLVLATSSDDRISRFRTGEALSAVMLTATSFHLAACPLSQPIEISDTRTMLRDRVLRSSSFPQLVLRTGWAHLSDPPIPASPRRPVDDVLSHFWE